jgi:hypothetical protein
MIGQQAYHLILQGNRLSDDEFLSFLKSIKAQSNILSQLFSDGRHPHINLELASADEMDELRAMAGLRKNRQAAASSQPSSSLDIRGASGEPHPIRKILLLAARGSNANASPAASAVVVAPRKPAFATQPVTAPLPTASASVPVPALVLSVTAAAAAAATSTAFSSSQSRRPNLKVRPDPPGGFCTSCARPEVLSKAGEVTG